MNLPVYETKVKFEPFSIKSECGSDKNLQNAIKNMLNYEAAAAFKKEASQLI